MDKMIFIRDFDNEDTEEGVPPREPLKIEFELPGDLTTEEFQVVCIRLAKAIGYPDIGIREVFGEPMVSDDQIYSRIRKLLKDNLGEKK